ncbi:acetolactate synthase-1/2/3 large subunit [Weissella uvarum]|uniref:acetolactate synthase AlsS n=1 Tax=Weissella uvarum TaxID=1479233 RepID=UPI0019619D31|nr:acetolactate synthase AlsS [Weissella uvarum]MBM7616661.1 acetolactate synthase-1/2/3 large subunit [Weissella uvarum]MCM0594881.1 acetolactate synthase AlsS [Weissella uvarum]
MPDAQRYGADLLVDTLNNNDIDLVFGIPGAKIDRLFERLEHPLAGQTSPRLVVVRHEQNAIFMAQAFARITGKPGAVIATSGPGVGNLATGLMTASAEGDPILAIGGQVPRKDLYRLTHQSTPSTEIFKPITNYSAEIQDPNNISEIVSNAIVAAKGGPKPGAAFVSMPQDVDDAPIDTQAIPAVHAPKMGAASLTDIDWLADQIKAAKLPVLLVGQRGSDDETTHALHELLEQTTLPVVETFQGAGVLSRELEKASFFGRIGLFRNQVGDRLLADSDLVITIGYDPIEYEPRNWNAEKNLRIVALDTAAAQIDNNFAPERQLIGNIADTMHALQSRIIGYELPNASLDTLASYKQELIEADEPNYTPAAPNLNHPLNIIKSLQAHVTDDMTVATDIGSHYIWMARHFKSYVPRHFLISNGMQTLGVGLPWAMAAAMVRPNAKAVSVSGDGGFYFSAQELSTAVELGLNTVSLVWNDNANYDMVKFQEEKKYEGQSAGVKFAPIDLVKFSESMGAKGLRVESPDQLDAVLDEAFATEGPVVVDIPVDYSHNYELAELVESEG